jgi:hypothetical protein
VAIVVQIARTIPMIEGTAIETETTEMIEETETETEIETIVEMSDEIETETTEMIEEIETGIETIVEMSDESALIEAITGMAAAIEIEALHRTRDGSAQRAFLVNRCHQVALQSVVFIVVWLVLVRHRQPDPSLRCQHHRRLSATNLQALSSEIALDISSAHCNADRELHIPAIRAASVQLQAIQTTR